MGSELKLAVLGDFRVLRDGQDVVLPPSRKTRALLAFLAVEPRAQRRERLCEIFWDIPDDPRGALRWSLSRIRSILGTTFVRADRNTVSLDARGFDCDFRRIASLRPDKLDELDAAEMEAIVESFRGNFLEDLYLPNCQEFEAWRVAHAERAALLHLRLLRRLVERTSNEPERALRYAHLLQRLVPEESGLAEEIARLTSAARQHAAGTPAVPSRAAEALARPLDAVDLSPRSALSTGADVTAPPLSPVVDSIRKQVSVLAAEIITPFQMLQDEDPEAGYSIIDPLVRAACREIERYGGIVISSSDANVVGLFGAASASESHAFQACRAALALKAAVGRGAPGQAQLCIGLDSGEAILRPVAIGDAQQIETQGVVVRSAIDLARSLRRSAIACTARMKGVIGGHVTMVPVEDFDCSEAVGTCDEIIAENTAVSRWQLRQARGLTPWIGRRKELEILGEACRGARAGAGQCLGIVADAGVGKSRLIHEFLTSDGASGCRIVECGALESDATSGFHIVKKLLRAILQIEEGDEPAVAAEKAAAWLERLGADGRMKAPLFFVLDIPVSDKEWESVPAAERVRRVQNTTMMVLALAARGELLIVLIEDLHWIDAESNVVLDRLIDGVGAQRILLLTTFRPEYAHAWSAKSWSAKRNYSQIRLEPLGRPEAELFLNATLGSDPTVRDLVPLIAERTDGVPLFMEETIQALAQSGALRGAPGAYAAPERIANLRVPPTVQSVIAARIDRLAPNERRLLQNAAIVGREVPLNILASMAGLDENATFDGVAKLQSAGFLYELQLYPVQIFVFKHALVQKVAYDSLIGSDRKVLHSRLIDAVEARLPHLIDDHVERLSEHAVIAERWDKAEQYLLRSAARALQRSSHSVAISFIGKGLEILERQPPSPQRDRTELEYQKLNGVAWMAAKGWGAQEVSAAYERVETLCEGLADESEKFTALRGRAQYYMIGGQPRAAQTISLRCADMAARMRDTGVTIETHHMFWTNNFFMGACTEAEKHAEESIALYDAASHHALTYKYSGHDPGVCSRGVAGLSAWHRGALDHAASRCREALELAERLAHPLTTALAYWALSHLHVLRQEPEPALDWARKEIAICTEFMLPLLHSQGVFQAGWATARLGDVPGGIAQMEQGVQGIRATGAEMGLPYLLGLLAEALAGAGQERRALALLDEAIGSAMQNGAHFLLSELMRIKAEVLCQAKDRDVREIEALLRSATDIAHKQNAPLPALRSATSLARLLWQHGRRAEAQEALAPYASLTAKLAGTRDAVSAMELT
jgi:DNA-binding SARP family transcriptional activator/predicted ATPase